MSETKSNKVQPDAQLVRFVNLDLEGRAGPDELAELHARVDEWRAILLSTIESVQKQLEARKVEADHELSPNWDSEKARAYRAWLRKANFFKKNVRGRLLDLDVQHAPRGALLRGIALDPTDTEAVSQWQSAAREVLNRTPGASRGRPRGPQPPPTPKE